MVSQKNIKELDFNTIEEYFQYIVDSIINGQKNQSKNLFEELSKKQKIDFYQFIGNGNETGLTLVEVLNVVNK